MSLMDRPISPEQHTYYEALREKIRAGLILPDTRTYRGLKEQAPIMIARREKEIEEWRAIMQE